MANWRKTVNIKDLLTTEESNESARRVAGEISARLNETFGNEKFESNLGDILSDFDDIAEDKNEPESLRMLNWKLEELYDWADEQRIWLGL